VLFGRLGIGAWHQGRTGITNLLRSEWNSVSPPTSSRHLFGTVECLFISFLIYFVSVYVVK
jgi:hypothetical protein